MTERAGQSLLGFLRQATARQSAADSTDGQLLARFLSSKDEEAFTALVGRHGPMVWGVCRRVLVDSQDAEDAFQATFLVLARKAQSVQRAEALGSWLYGVAYRTALKARERKGRVRARETEVASVPRPRSPDEVLQRDLRQVLDEEVNRLPPKYRAAFVLCCLDGQTHEEASQSLGCPRKTVTSRLASALKQLRGRLTRRGIALSVSVLTALLTQEARAEVPGRVAKATVRAALAYVGGPTVTPTASPRSMALSREVLQGMRQQALRQKLTLLLSLGCLGVLFLVWVFYPGNMASSTAEQRLHPPGQGGPSTGDKQLDGSWEVREYVFNGERQPPLEPGGFQYTFSGDEVTFVGVGFPPMKGSLWVDVDVVPHQISAGGPGDALRMHGIYKFEGDSLILCTTSWNQPMPKVFGSTPGSNQTMMTLRKQVPPR